jgi:transcriptional regulator of acetoin/glycerol metabolism
VRDQRARYGGGDRSRRDRPRAGSFLCPARQPHLHGSTGLRAGCDARRRARRFLRVPHPPAAHPGAGRHGGDADRERPLSREYHRAALVLAFHSRGEYLHTLSAGLLALDAEGAVLGANTQARFLLHGPPARPGRWFEELFRLRFSIFLDHAAGQERLRLEDKAGSTFIGRIETLRRPRGVPVGQASPARASAPEPGGEFVAEDLAVRAELAKVAGAVGRRLPILIRGATGTGKEVMARHVHALSGRRGVFVAVNCAALPAHLVEAELFGHVDGAVTGARRGGAPGLIVEAEGGTLPLDEIGDIATRPPGGSAPPARRLDRAPGGRHEAAPC